MTAPCAGRPVTRIERPRPSSRRPSSRSSRSARRTVLRLTPRTVARSRAWGMRSPGAASPSAIARRISAATCSCRGAGSLRSTGPSAMPGRSLVVSLTPPIRPTRIASMATPIKTRRLGRVSEVLRSLFPEAWLAQRRRRRRYLLLGLASAGLAALIASLVSGAPQRSTDSAASAVTSVSVSSRALGRAGDFFSLAVVNGRLLVSGGPSGSLFDSGATTDISHGRPVGVCDAETVDPTTLTLSGLVRGNCGDPALYGERVLPISYVYRGLPPQGGTTTMAIRIATVDPSALDGYRLGPIVATYPQCSDCGPQWIHGDGSLWIYDHFVGPTFTSQTGQLLRVSDSTGNVVQRWPMPSISRPLVAVNADGFWLAPTIESGWPAHTPQSQLIRYQSLYHAWAGATAPTRVLGLGGSGAVWLVASGHTVWLEANRNPLAKLWRLNGMTGKPTLLGAYRPGSNQGGEFGARAPTYAGNAAIGIYYVANPYNDAVGPTTQQIIRLSPEAPVARTVATVKAPASQLYASSPPSV